MKNKYALILSGGGARGAYQLGALAAVVKILKKNSLEWPFEVMIGTSAGAINLSLFLSRVDWAHPEKAIKELEKIWANLESDLVYKTNWTSVLGNGLNWIKTLALKGEGHSGNSSMSLLDPAPLYNSMKDNINLKTVNHSIDTGPVKTIAINALSYRDGYTKTYFKSREEITPWKRFKREAVKTDFTLRHLLASSAIPILFPSVEIDNHFHCDGSVRDYAPFSPAIHFGANKILMIGVRKNYDDCFNETYGPSTARVINMILDSLMQDSFEIDLERMNLINTLLDKKNKKSQMFHVDAMILKPTNPLSKVSIEEFDSLPSSIKYLVRGLGPMNDIAELVSYILFEGKYLKKLIKMGEVDTLQKEEQIIKFLTDSSVDLHFSNAI